MKCTYCDHGKSFTREEATRMSIKFEVPGRAVAAVRTTQRQMHVDPKYLKYKDYKEYFGFYARQAVKQLIIGPVEVVAVAYLCGRDQDVDNLGKSFLDSMNKLVYEDDRQVQSLSVRKRKAATKDKQRVEIEIRVIGTEEDDAINAECLATHQLWYEEYQKGSSCRTVAEKYGLNAAKIHKAFKDHGWETRKRGRSRRK
jgi:Holliday junction resolvase RusA-like endonuclease